MEGLNFEKLKERKSETTTTLATNAAYITESSTLIDDVKHGHGKSVIIRALISLFFSVGLSVLCFTLGNSQLSYVVGWIFASFAIFLFLLLCVLAISLKLTIKSVDKRTEENIKLEAELKDINDKLAEEESATKVKKTRRSKKNKSAEVNE